MSKATLTRLVTLPIDLEEPRLPRAATAPRGPRGAGVRQLRRGPRTGATLPDDRLPTGGDGGARAVPGVRHRLEDQTGTADRDGCDMSPSAAPRCSPGWGGVAHNLHTRPPVATSIVRKLCATPPHPGLQRGAAEGLMSHPSRSAVPV